ncbi:hypothetical protein COHA_001903 [Chlorella ohadii]|uniref:Uncharacterized protein n=1 Tax=Chlorella ohadii TaxID=2649997 RepID=A0AAD5DYG4_9CHLO|nr:hypothetical protein COHA_001903 [Chlorella ohadii]
MQAASAVAARPIGGRYSRAQAAHRRPCPIRCSRLPGVPDYGYGQPNVPGEKKQGLEDPHDRLRRQQEEALGTPQQRKWWDYGAASASVGRPDIEQKPVTIPQLSPDDGNGGSSGGSNGGGGSGGGGGGSGGNGGSGGSGPMRGFTYLFAALLMAGGLAAFVRRGSVKSLLFSAAAAMLLLISASVMHRRVGTLLALGTTLVLAGVMGQRANRSGKVFPAGVVAILSALMSIGYARTLA